MGLMLRLIARWRAMRKERSALLKMVDLLREEDRQVTRALVRAMCGTIDPDTVWVPGKRYACHRCGKRYRQGRQNVWGLCRRCC